MNAEQLERLRNAVQWAVTQATQGRVDGPGWNQGSWAEAPLADDATERTVTLWSDGMPGPVKHVVELACPSSCCIAGNVVVSEGDRMLASLDFDPAILDVDEEVSAYFCESKDGVVEQIQERARKLLGISSHEAGFLFGGDNMIDEIVEIATEIAEAYGHDLGIEVPVLT